MDLVNLFVGLAILVGLVGVVMPVLPGSLIIGLAVLIWAIDAEQVGGWITFVLVVLLLIAGWSATYVLTGKRVSDAGIPRRSIIAAGLAGIVGFFIIPVLGLFLFFAGGLYAAEYHRLGDNTRARQSAVLALKATGLGLVVELGLALLAAGTWLVAVLFFSVGP